MTDKQPEALRLAKRCEWFARTTGGIESAFVGKDMLMEAAAELRRLHIEVERLIECLRRANGLAEHFERHWYLRGDQIDHLLEALREAKESIMDWGAYAGEYFQNKYDLDGDIAKVEAALAKAEGK